MSPLIWRIFDLVSVPGLAYQVQFLCVSCKTCVCVYLCLLPLVSRIVVSMWDVTSHVWILSTVLVIAGSKNASKSPSECSRLSNTE